MSYIHLLEVRPRGSRWPLPERHYASMHLFIPLFVRLFIH